MQKNECFLVVIADYSPFYFSYRSTWCFDSLFLSTLRIVSSYPTPLNLQEYATQPSSLLTFVCVFALFAKTSYASHFCYILHVFVTVQRLAFGPAGTFCFSGLFFNLFRIIIKARHIILLLKTFVVMMLISSAAII